MAKKNYNNEIVREYDEHYQESYYAWNPFYPLADRDLRYYLGEQWDEKERQKLFSEGRNALSFNYIRRNINLLTGYQRKHRLSSVVIPVENSDQKSADQFSKLLLHTMNAGDGYKFISEGFGGALKTGFNLLTIWMDYRDDPINGDIRFGREPYNGFITDPYFTQLDFSDCSYVIKRKYLSPKQTASLLPGREKEVMELSKFGWSRDDKFTWLPYQTQPNGQDFMAFNEFYKQGWENVSALVDEETGEFTEWEGDAEGLRYFLQTYPQLKEVKRPKKYIERHIIVNDQLMLTEKNQFGLNEYPFVPMVAIFEPESEFWGLKMQSLVRCQVDPQKEANRRRSQMIDILDSNINSGWLAKKDSVVNPRSLFQTSQGKVIWKEQNAEPGDIERIQPAQLPQGMFELQRQFDQDIMNIAGVNDAAFGQTENAQESGLMMMLRQGASIVNLQDIIDNLRYAQKLISKKALKLIQTWTPAKIKRIINEDPTDQFYSKEFIKYDVEVQEGVLTDTQRQLYFRQLTDLYQLTGGPQSSVVTPDMLAKAAPLQGKSEFNEQVEQNVKAQQQQAQQQQQIQQQILNSQLELNKANSIKNIASAKEDITRGIANMGLQEERNSEAIQNRAQASLDRARTMKELEAMDDDKLMKYMKIVQMMDAVNKVKEEENKAEDVAITAASEKMNAAFPQQKTTEGQAAISSRPEQTTGV
jgi:hypothetical protein